MTRILCSALLLTALATPASAGPSWISIEYPANPHHASTRNAALLVRAYHHSNALNVPVRGTAEGIIDGKRTSLALDIRATNLPGVFAVRTPLPTRGTWVLAIRLDDESNPAGAVVTLDGRGRIANVEVPSTRSRDGWTVPRPLQASDIDAALRAASVANGDARTDGSALALAGLMGLLFVVGATRRRAA